MEADLYANKPPKKQGLQYSLNLGQNNGPFLAKDITHSNPNSLRLLVGEEKIKEDPGTLQRVAASFTLQTLKLDEPEEIYDQDRKIFINYDEKYKAKFDAAQNLTSSANFSKATLDKLIQDSKDLKTDIKSHRQSMNDLTAEITRRHQKNTETIQIIMKTFYHNLKEQLYSKKNENYHLVRELQQLQRDKNQLQQEVQFCSRRIAELETVVGLQKAAGQAQGGVSNAYMNPSMGSGSKEMMREK